MHNLWARLTHLMKRVNDKKLKPAAGSGDLSNFTLCKLDEIDGGINRRKIIIVLLYMRIDYVGILVRLDKITLCCIYFLKIISFFYMLCIIYKSSSFPNFSIEYILYYSIFQSVFYHRTDSTITINR